MTDRLTNAKKQEYIQRLITEGRMEPENAQRLMDRWCSELKGTRHQCFALRSWMWSVIKQRQEAFVIHEQLIKCVRNRDII